MGLTFEDACRDVALGIAQGVIEKQHDYGHDNILVFKEQGLVVRLWDKINRLKNLVWKNTEPKNESIVDTFTDIAGYAIIGLMLAEGSFTNELADDKMDDGFITKIKLLRTIKNISIGTEITCTYTIWKATSEMKKSPKENLSDFSYIEFPWV